MTTPEVETYLQRPWWLLALVGLGTGLLSGAFGVSGGVVLVPAFVVLCGIPQRRAHGTSLAAILPIALSGMIGYAVHGSIDVAAALLLGGGGVIGAVVGARLLMRVPVPALRRAFGVLLLITAVRLFLEVTPAEGQIAITAATGAALIGCGLFVGLLSGLLGVGGGIVVVPILILFFGVDDVVAKGTSLLVAIATGLSGTATNLAGRNVDLRTAAWAGVAGIPSAAAGAQLARVLPLRLSLILFALLILYSAYRLLRPSRSPAKA